MESHAYPSSKKRRKRISIPIYLARDVRLWPLPSFHVRLRSFLNLRPRERLHLAEGSDELVALRLEPTLLFPWATLSFARDGYRAAASWRPTSSGTGPGGRPHHS